jgi:SAM-dependent methyltransferase
MSETAPPRSREALRHHFEVERELAARLRASTREERTALFGRLYGELFERVPDHPRHTRKGSEVARRRGVQAQMRLLQGTLRPGQVFVEFAPGDGWLSNAVAATAAQVYAIDISDQRDLSTPPPANVHHVVYDGYHVDLPDACADVVFSYQFLEHLHPDDVAPHFELVRRLLKPGGCYVFDTPHRYSGPHDISRHFGDRLDCFHFQEWTHRDMRRLLGAHGFSEARVFRMGRPQTGLFNALVDGLEWLLQPLPHRLRRRLCGRLFPSVAMVATKDSAPA